MPDFSQYFDHHSCTILIKCGHREYKTLIRFVPYYLLKYTAAVAQLVGALAPQAEGWVF